MSNVNRQRTRHKRCLCYGHPPFYGVSIKMPNGGILKKKNVYSPNSWLWQNVNERVTHSAVCAKNASALHSWKMTIIGLLFFIISRPQRAQITSKKLLECFSDKCDKILSETEHISHNSLFFHPHMDIPLFIVEIDISVNFVKQSSEKHFE